MSKSFSFQWNGKGALPGAQPLTVSIVDADTGLPVADSVSVNVAGSTSWLTVNPAAGPTVFGSQVGLSSTVKNFLPGTYQGQIEVTSPNPDVLNSPQVAPVLLTIQKKGRR